MKTMKSTHVGLTVAALLIVMPFLVGWRGSDPDLALQPKSRIWASGTSNVKNFDCNAATMDITVQTNRPDAVHEVSIGTKAVGKVNLTVPVAAMDCNNGTMNGHMKDALKASDHPAIEFNLESYDLVSAASSMTVTLNGSLSIGGTSKPVTIAAQATDIGGGVLHLTGEYDVHMKDFGLKPPSLFMGTMKVDEKVQVHFDLLLKS
jgi:polyisoprenoid-binding protein YceI